MYIWLPYFVPSLPSFKRSLWDFERSYHNGSEHQYFSDSLSVGVPQMAGAPESLYVRLENRKIVAMGNIYCGSRVCKKKNCLQTAIKAYASVKNLLEYPISNRQCPIMKLKKHKTRQKRRSVARVTGYGARATRNKRRLTEIFLKFARLFVPRFV
jgi:hypothetical protein